MQACCGLGHWGRAGPCVVGVLAMFVVSSVPGIRGLQDVVLVLGGGEDRVFQVDVLVCLVAQGYVMVRVRSVLL